MIRRSLAPFVRASILHIGAAAAAASLRHDLVNDHQVTASEIDRAYAVSRVTPGTNLLALYAVLGHRLGGWPLAVQAVAAGAVLPALLALSVTIVYTHWNAPVVAHVMSGARAGGVAVFIGASVRLIRPQLATRRVPGAVLAVALALAAWLLPVGPFTILLAAGAVGAVVLRP
jgi:chromate transport protein ChrA